MSGSDMIRRGDVRKAVTSIAVFSLDSDELNAKAVSVIHRATQAIEAIPAITTQPAPRDEVIKGLIKALDNLLDAVTAEDNIGDHALVITGPKGNVEWLIEATDDARAALAAAKAVIK